MLLPPGVTYYGVVKSQYGKLPEWGLELRTSDPEPRTQPLHHIATTTHIHTHSHTYIHTHTHTQRNCN